MMVFLLALATASALQSPIELKIGDLASTSYLRHQARVKVTNHAAVDTAVTLEWSLKPPVEGARGARKAIRVPAGGASDVFFDYELFEAGDHLVAVIAKAGGQELARWEGHLMVRDTHEAPSLFPNYYRQSLTIVGGTDVSTSFGHPALPGARSLHMPARGAGTVSYRTSEGRIEVPVTIVPKPAGKRSSVALDPPSAGGRRWFPLGFLATPFTRQRRLELREAGFDLVRLNAQPPQEMREALDSLAAAHLRASVVVGSWLQSPIGDTAESHRKLRELVAAIGEHPALAFWESVDEPAWGGQPAWGLQQGYAFLHQIDPLHPIWTTHAPRNTIETLAWYNQATDIAGCDIYPVPLPQKHSNLPDSTLGVVADETMKSLASVNGEKPVFMTLQGFAWRILDDFDDPTAVYPTFAESRFMAYDAIVAGASGLMWWTPDGAEPRPGFWADLKRLVSELRAIAPLLEAPVVTGRAAARVTRGEVKICEHATRRQRALFVVNRSAAPRVCTIVPGGRPRRHWHALFGDPAPRSHGDTLTVALPAWSACVLSTDPALNPVRKEFVAHLTAAPVGDHRSSLTAGPGNPVRNASFEIEDESGELPAGWIVPDPTTAQLDREVLHSGAASLRITGEAPVHKPFVIQRKIPVEAGHAYRLSAWMRSDTPHAKARFYVEWVPDGSFHSKVLPWVEPGATWTEQELTFVASPDPRGALYVVLQVEGPGRVWFDDVRLDKTD